MELLSRLLGGTEKVKIMRFFLHHDEQIFQASTISEKTKSKGAIVRKELNALVAAGFLEKKKAKMVVSQGNGKKATSKVKEVSGFKLNTDFPHNEALRALLFDFQLLDKKELALRFKAVGRIKLFVLAGIFLGETKSRVDVLLVGEGIKRQKAEKVLEGLSAEIGRDVVYSIMDLDEYAYRLKMYDKFIRDILDMPREVVIDRLKEQVK